MKEVIAAFGGIEMKPIKVENEDILKAISSELPYIEIGNRKFLLFEVDRISEKDVYEVTDYEEERLLLEALEGDNPILSETEIDKMLGASK
ncbi:MAG: hypothetical protein ACYCVD_19585 [Desulfitobacteriaceae bacterium]